MSIDKERRKNPGESLELSLSFSQEAEDFLKDLSQSANGRIMTPLGQVLRDLTSVRGFLRVVHNGVQEIDFHNLVRDTDKREKGRRARLIALEIVSPDLFPDSTAGGRVLPRPQAMKFQKLVGSYRDITDEIIKSVFPISDEQKKLLPDVIYFSKQAQQRLAQDKQLAIP